MTKFEQNGVNIQHECFTKGVAIERFKRSCNICCLHGLHIECDKCAIAAAHNMVIAAIDCNEGGRKVC